jgi:hypothetical protein
MFLSEIGKIMTNIKQNNQGSAIFLSILIINILLFISIFFLNFALNENKIAKSHALAQRTYYLAETGVNEAIWRIKNDPSFRSGFLEDSWATTSYRVAPFGNNSESYQFEITNSSKAHSVILATGNIDLGNNKKTQRKVRTYVYQAIGESVIGDNGGYADGNIDISSSIVNFYNGSAHSNNNFIVNNNSVVTVDSDLNAAGNYLKHSSANVSIASSTYAANFPPAAPQILMPAVDFNSVSPDSLLNRANTVYTEAQFSTLMKNNQNLLISGGITYVQGDVEVAGNQIITIENGLLVVERDFTIGFKEKWEGRTGPSSLYIDHAAAIPSGVIAGRHINILEHTQDVESRGVIYANDLMDIKNFNAVGGSFNVYGGLIARKLTISSCWNPINIYYDSEIIDSTLGSATTSPTIIVEHWEEEY